MGRGPVVEFSSFRMPHLGQPERLERRALEGNAGNGRQSTDRSNLVQVSSREDGETM